MEPLVSSLSPHTQTKPANERLQINPRMTSDAHISGENLSDGTDDNAGMILLKPDNP